MCPDICIISETWEGSNRQLNDELDNSSFKAFSYYRKARASGGGAAIIYNESRYIFERDDSFVNEDLEHVWAICKPRVELSSVGICVKNIAIGS